LRIETRHHLDHRFIVENMANLDHKRAILWDMDGVLVDTGEYHYAAWKQTFDELGVPFSRKQFRETFGMNNASIMRCIAVTTTNTTESLAKADLILDSLAGLKKNALLDLLD
jgi:beta-phosphoglucomutase-like phosphatase (HAD superfamily)